MPRVLVVADDPAERQRATSALALLDDMAVVEVPSGHDAAALLRGGDVDVLIVDGDIDNKGGCSWLYELREQASLAGHQRPPAIVMISREQDRFLADWAGAQATITKPVDGFEIAEMVTSLVATPTG